jgi:hypothetical protein
MTDEQPGWRERLLEGTRDVIERRTGYTLETQEKLSYLEESDLERRMIQKDLDLMAYTALNYVGGQPQDLKPVERRRLAQRSRIVWMKDPQAGAAVDLMNDFTFGRGMTPPKANDDQVQEIIDEAWADPDNQLVLTSFQAQLALGTDLELQSNLFLLVFEDGEDGKVKLGLLDHDTVETVVRDPDNRLRILYYVARHYVVQWDFQNDRPIVLTDTQSNANNNAGQAGGAPTRPENSPLIATGAGTLKYYEHWRNVADLQQDVADDVRDPTPLCPLEKLGNGKVFHVAVNRGSEMAFGHPRMDRLIRWFNAYNCHDEQTETLTSEGWLGLAALEARAESQTMPQIAAFDGDRIVFELPELMTIQPFDGDLLYFKGATGLDIAVTEGHRMMVKTRYRQDEPWEFVTADKVWGGRGHIAPTAAPVEDRPRCEAFVLPGVPVREQRVFANGNVETIAAVTGQLTVPMDAWLEWMGWWVAEGYGRAEVCQAQDSPHLPALKAVCAALGVEGTDAGSDSRMWRWRPARGTRQIADWLTYSCGTSAQEKHLPPFVFELPADQSMQLLRGLMGGDGTDNWELKGRGYYATVSLLLADDVQRVAMLAGWRATVKHVMVRGKITYRVHLAARQTRRLPQGERHRYQGRVYCFQTPTGTMVTRRNGCVAITGNSFMDARVDIMAASAAFVMKRKVKGTPQQLERMANQALSRRSVLGMSQDPEMGAMLGPKAGGVLTENDAVEHSDFNINTNAPAAAQDAQMIRSQISAATRWPASYLGDASQSNLATATSLELPVLKTVEARQEMFESVVRFFIDRAIERAVDTGRITQQLGQTGKSSAGKTSTDKPAGQPKPVDTEPTDLQQAFEDQSQDEADTARDLGYEFKMPSPLKRLLGDVVTAVQAVATTFDPNNSNTNLSRTLLTIALSELDLEDPAGAVEKIFPRGYTDPVVAAQEGPPGGSDGQQGSPGNPLNFSGDADSSGGGGFGGDSNNGYGGGYAGGNPYGAPSGSQAPEDAMEAALQQNSAAMSQRAAQRAAKVNRMLDDELDAILSETPR